MQSVNIFINIAILLILNWPGELRSDQLAFSERYASEVICDSIAKFTPLVGQSFAEEVEDSLGELVECWIVPIVRDPFMHDAPQALDRVEMWSICRQEMQPHPAFRAIQPWLEYPGVVVSGIVDKDMYGRHRRIVALRFFQHGAGGLRADLLAFDKGKLEGFKVERALNVEPFAP